MTTLQAAPVLVLTDAPGAEAPPYAVFIQN
jgi:hypothetical protein